MQTQQKQNYPVKAMMAVLLLGGFLSLFNETILNVALPSLMTAMNVTATTVQWLATGYMLIVAILVPVTAFLIHTYTTKQLYISAMALFLIGTLLAIFSKTFALLLIARMIQATGTGMLIPIMMNTALIINPPEKRGAAMGLCISAILLGPAFGPIASGILLQFFKWQALFIVLVPLSLSCIVMGTVFLKNAFTITKPPIDYRSILLSTLGFGGVIYGISAASGKASGRLAAMLLLCAGVLLLALFAKRQLTLSQPILEMRAFTKPLFTTGVLLLILIQMIQFSMNMLLPMLLQQGFGTTSLLSAMVLLPSVLLNGFMTPVTGKIYDKLGGRVLIPAGMIVIGISLFLLSLLGASAPIWSIGLVYCFTGIGIAMAMPTSQTNAISQLSRQNQADGVAITNTSMQLGAAIGAPLFVGVMAAGQSSYLDRLQQISSYDRITAIFHGFSHTLVLAAILAGVGFVLSLSLWQKGKNMGGIEAEDLKKCVNDGYVDR